LNVSSLAKIANIECSFDPEVLKQLEFNVLATIGFKIYPAVLPTEIISKFMLQIEDLQDFSCIPASNR